MAQVRVATFVASMLCAFAFSQFSVLAADSRLQIVSFTSATCQPCKSMQPVLEKLAREGWQIRQVDVQAHPELVKTFDVTSLPTLVVIEDRRVVHRIVGTLGYAKLVAQLEQASQSVASPIQPANPQELLAIAGSKPESQARSATSNPVGNQVSNTEPMAVRGQSPMADSSALAMNSARGTALEMTEFDAPPARTAPQPTPGQRTIPASLTSMNAPGARSAAPMRSTLSTDERAQRATVRIKIEDANSIAFGTGTVISLHGDQALVLTCGHIFRGIGRDAVLSVDLFDRGRTINVPAQAVSHTTEQGDIGLIEFRSPLAIDPVPIADANSLPEIGAPAFSFGCDQGADPTRRDTQIKRINRYLGPANIEIAGAPVLGRSGGGLFNARGQLIGVCNAADNEDDEGIYASLPVIHQHVAALKLDSLPHDPVDSPAQAAPVQFASASQPNPAPSDYWPDQKFAGQTSPASAAPAMTSPTLAPSSPAAQVRCVIRDASGQETTVTIDRASEELVAMLKSHAR